MTTLTADTLEDYGRALAEDAPPLTDGQILAAARILYADSQTT